jgi:hypothetical protein
MPRASLGCETQRWLFGEQTCEETGCLGFMQEQVRNRAPGADAKLPAMQRGTRHVDLRAAQK